jgi:hypothetical protein
VTKKISRAQWEQIRRRVLLLADFTFDPKWKCLIDGLPWNKCREHDEDDMADIIKQVREKYEL